MGQQVQFPGESATCADGVALPAWGWEPLTCDGRKAGLQEGEKWKASKRNEGSVPTSYLTTSRTMAVYQLAPASASLSLLGTKAEGFQKKVLFLRTISGCCFLKFEQVKIEHTGLMPLF